jgi:hypothetical protein
MGVRRIFSLFGSPKLAIVLLAALAAALVAASVLEVNHGSAWSRWFVYESRWFAALLALLGIHILFAVASRLPWKVRHAGLVIACAGLLAVITGAFQSLYLGFEGRISFGRGEMADQIVLSDRGQITAFPVGKTKDAALEFAFNGGPDDWTPGKVLDLGTANTIKARILGYCRHSQASETWIADASRQGGPAVRFRATAQNGTLVAEGWLVDQMFGDAVAVGPLRLDLQRAASDRMLEDFLRPPIDRLGKKGLLAMYLGDAVTHVPLDTYAGGKIRLGNTGAAVEIAEYLPNARPDARGNFSSKDDLPRNPMVELRVYLPGVKQPLRQIAFAKDPLLNLDGVYPVVCPVKFRFDHPAVQRQTAVELLQTSDGRLFGRLSSGGRYAVAGELRRGSQIAVPGICQVEITQHVSQARREVTVAHDLVGADRIADDASEPAALVELTVDGHAEQAWLRRSDPAYGQTVLAMPCGPIGVSYDHAKMPLGFSLQRIGSGQESRQGATASKAKSVTLRVVDRRHGLEHEHVITAREPLWLGNLAVCLADESSPGSEAASFVVSCDPGRTWKYCGGLIIGLGIAVMCFTRAHAALRSRGTTQRGAAAQVAAAAHEDRPLIAPCRAA